MATESTPDLVTRDLSAQHHATHCKDAVTYFRKARAANERCAREAVHNALLGARIGLSPE